MNFASNDSLILYLLGSLVLIEICAMIILYCLRRSTTDDNKGSTHFASVTPLRPLRREGVIREITRLEEGGELDEAVLKSFSAEDKALFEVMLIDALSELTRHQQHKLRSTLVKHGYDEHCARQLVRSEISVRVRASTLLNLLRPQSPGVRNEPEASNAESASPRVRKAGSG